MFLYKKNDNIYKKICYYIIDGDRYSYSKFKRNAY